MTALRVLYLKRALSVEGYWSFAGRKLFDYYKSIADDQLVGHIVVSPEEAARMTNVHLAKDVIGVSQVTSLDPNVIYLEGGLFADPSGTWRIPRPVLEALLSAGGVLFVADADINHLRHNRTHYLDAYNFLRVRADHGPGDSSTPVGLYDNQSSWQQSGQHPLFRVEDMSVSDWLEPIYSDVATIATQFPVHLSGVVEVLATGNRNSTQRLWCDTFLDDYASPWPFASVARYGDGWIVFIAASVSDDRIASHGDNWRWLRNTAEFLLSSTTTDQRRMASVHRSPYLVFLSHRSVDSETVHGVASEVRKLGVGIWLDHEKLLAGDSLVESISHALGKMSHFALFWSKSCASSSWVMRELSVAVTKLVENRVPILVIRLDDAPLPDIISDLIRLEAVGKPATQVAEEILTSLNARSGREARGG